MSSRSPRVGDVIADKYRVERVLGSGAMGVVVKAWHLVLDHPVALKFVHPSLCAQPEALKRFALEARAAARLRCEHAVRIYDVDRAPDGTPYIVMELLEGEPLSALAARDVEPLPPRDVARFMIQACKALAEAHDAGVLHRDVKPDNLFLSRGVVKVLDFGLAKCLDSAEGTNGTFAIGSPQYMSPEQVRGLPLDRRTDIWSLGATFYELLTGRPAYDAPSPAAVFACIIQLSPAPPRAVRPEIPEALADVVMRCLRHDPNERFGDARELAIAIERALTDDGRRHASTIVLRRPSSILAKLAGPTLTLVVALSCACVGLAVRRTPAMTEAIIVQPPPTEFLAPPLISPPPGISSPDPKPGARSPKPGASKKRPNPYDRP